MIPLSIASAAELQAIIADSFVADCEFHPTLLSTNNRGLELANDDTVKLPLLVYAKKQTAGRGRGRSPWHSPTGGLAFSLLLNPNDFHLTTRRQSVMSLLVALATAKMVQAVAPQANVCCKWPNDVLIAGAKLAGILIEAPRPNRMVIGVGINVNNLGSIVKADLPAVSLADVHRSTVPISQVLKIFLAQFQQLAMTLIDQPSLLVTTWDQFDCLRNQRVIVSCGQDRKEGDVLGITEDGFLLLQTDSRRCQITSGTVRLAT